MIEVKAPIQQFLDTDGSPLDAGYIYIGASGANPETTPQSVYWDKDGLIPATQPIRTLNGYPSRDGALSRFFTSSANWSISVKNKKGELVYSASNTDSGVFDALSASSGAAGVGYDNASSGLSANNVQAAIDEVKSDSDVVAATVAGLANENAGVINLFANSAFMINQRGYVSATNTTAPNQYTLDRIRVVTSGQSLTFAASTFGNKMTAPAGGAEQVIEGNRITGGKYACAWVGSGTIQVNGTPRSKNEAFSLTAGVNCTVRMFGEFEQFMFTRPNMIGIYEYDYARDLALCRWYTKRIRDITCAGFSATTAIASVSEPMRAAPTLTLSGGALFGNGGSYAVVSIGSALGGAADYGFAFDMNVSSGLVASGSYNYRGGYVLASAEL